MKNQLKCAAMILVAAALTFTACGGSSGGGDNAVGDSPITISSIAGVAPPAFGQTPVTTITETDQYTGSVAWSSSPATFAATTAYTATITLTAKTGFTLTGVSANFFTVAVSSTAINAVNSGVITAVFPATGDGTITYTFPGGTVAKIITTPNILGVTPTATFPTGTDDYAADYKPVPAQFIIAETLTTYELWITVKTWATGHGYSFANAGTIGSGNSGSTQQPVTTINWRDAMVWCNALTEYYNANNGSGTDLAVVYCSNGGYTTPIKVSTNSSTITYTTNGSQDAPYVNPSAKGFRLPSSVEYEFAARYRGADTTNAIASNGVYYTKGNSASGATADYNNATATALVAVCGVTSTATVKSKAANTLGLFDMSGNAWEWNFDWDPGYIGSDRVLRGGSFSYVAYGMQVGVVGTSYPYYADPDVGFRFVRTY